MTVQIMVHIRPADRPGKRCFEIFDCEMDTGIRELKQMIENLGETSGRYRLPVEKQELVFQEERCENDKALRDYGISEEFIKQVAGFVVNPERPGKRFVEGVLVPY
ncbi:hypothetical protein CVIRNUC_001104 [Coccomyxa viridis]|uniref:Ubiquitin-like domain-containing protein n=1 Tax=Coccomyxa viridis TaxID=1274662 RepID=A0AAV1HTU4_9CHLO|nr:hypothetical protein CVIRNUC_001104 [Coccomyxa viridis]